MAPLIVVRLDTWGTPLIALLADEVGNDGPGQEVVRRADATR